MVHAAVHSPVPHTARARVHLHALVRDTGCAILYVHALVLLYVHALCLCALHELANAKWTKLK